MRRSHSDVDDPKSAPAQRLKDAPHMRLKLSVSHLGVGRLSHCAVGRCQKHRGTFRPEPKHATPRQTALPEGQFQTLEYWQDMSPAQRQDS